jgi:hypothetical protein
MLSAHISSSAASMVRVRVRVRREEQVDAQRGRHLGGEGRYRGDIGEIQGRYRGDIGEHLDGVARAPLLGFELLEPPPLHLHLLRVRQLPSLRLGQRAVGRAQVEAVERCRQGGGGLLAGGDLC